MFAALVFALAAGVADVPAKEPAAILELFAEEVGYLAQNAKEEDFIGVLEKVNTPEVGFDRFNPYRLVMSDGDKKTTREVYVEGKTDILHPYVGKTIKLTGKAVDTEVEGTVHKEIWPARLKVVAVNADLMAKRRLYDIERGQEKEYGGTLHKGDKGGYYLEMKQGDKTTTENLKLYGEVGDPLAPYVGKKVKVSGKKVTGAIGIRTFEDTLPGRLEMLPLTPEEKKEKEEHERNETELQRIVEGLRDIKRRLRDMNDCWVGSMHLIHRVLSPYSRTSRTKRISNGGNGRLRVGGYIPLSRKRQFLVTSRFARVAPWTPARQWTARRTASSRRWPLARAL
jgi:hypothetical protein